MKLSVTKDLDALRAEALHRIDAAARRKRNDVAGQNADVHAMKLAEARAYLAGGSAGPLLAAEGAGGEAMLARQIVDKADQTASLLAKIEVDRQSCQKAIRTATTPAAIEAATKPVLAS